MEAAEVLDAVLYLDNLGDLFAENAAGGIDLPSVMKPYLEEGRVRVLAEARPELLDRLENRAPGFFAVFARLRVEPLSAEATKRLLTSTVRHDRAFAPHRPTLADDAVETLVGLADRYLSYLAFPGKAMRLYDELRAMHERERDAQGVPVVIDRARVTQAFSRQTGVPSFLLQEQEALSAPLVVKQLSRFVVGQTEAVRHVAELVAVIKARLATGEKPLATLLFVGPTGVGKTELARALSTYLFGREERMVRFDMSEYMDSEAADRLLRGTSSQEGALTRKVREQPFCVLLLDEIEKAHPGVFDLLLQVTGEGRLTDARGRTAYFHNAILILTSNLGAAGRRAPVGFERSVPADGTYYEKVVEKTFRPELVNRLDRIVAFRALGPSEVATIARSALAKIGGRRGFSEASIRLVLSETINAAGDTPETYLARAGYSEALGARALRRTLEDQLVSPVAALLTSLGAEAHDLDVLVAMADADDANPHASENLAARTVGHLAFRAVRVQKRARQGRSARSVADIAALRRRADALLDLPGAEDLRDHLAYLTADLASARGKRKGGREQAVLLAEHDRESRALAPVEAVLEKIRTLEEVAMAALFEGESVDALADDATALASQLLARVPAMLLAREPLADHVALVLDELDEHRALDAYVLPLLAAAKSRDWSIKVSVPKHVAPREAARGAWCSPAEVVKLLADPARTFRSVLLEIVGPLALLLGLERGRHVLRGLAPGTSRDSAELYVTFLKRGTLTPADFGADDAKPLHGTGLSSVRAASVVRVRDHAAGTTKVGGAEPVSIPPEAYFVRFDELLAPTLIEHEQNPTLDRWALFEGDLD
jgi:ATP-dependent Clp protease ATP-binding subunit ClpC